MSTAKLNVWVTAVGDPCRIDTQHQWFVHVLHCDGRALEWCDRVYVNIPTKCAHAEIEVPPGCYLVVTTWSPAPVTSGNQVITSLGNHISHVQIVRADCAREYCVTLFPPTFHWCGIWWLIAARTHLEVNARTLGNAAEPVKRAVDAMEAAMKALGEPDALSRNMLELAKPPRRTKK